MTDHTPTPWSGGKTRIIVREVPGMCDGGDYYAVAEAHYHSFLSYNEAAANAAFIVKAVNNHDALVRALDDLANIAFMAGLTADNTEAWQKARLALGAVGGPAS